MMMMMMMMMMTWRRKNLRFSASYSRYIGKGTR